QGEPEALLQGLRLGEGGEIQISGKLLGCGRHSLVLPTASPNRRTGFPGPGDTPRTDADQASVLVSSALGMSTLPPRASMAETTPALAWVTLKVTFLASKALGPSTRRTPSSSRRMTPALTSAWAS